MGMKCTDKCKCPYCNSKNYKQVDDDRKYEYPIMFCKDCKKEFWSD